MNGRMKSRMADIFSRTVLILFIGVLLAFHPGPLFAENACKLTIVSIDTAKILEAHPAFVKAQKDFETQIQGMQEKLKGMSEEKQMAAQEQMQQQAKQQGEKLQKEALAEVKKDLQKIADEKGYDYIFDSNSLIIGGKDVTAEVMKAMNLEEKTQK